MVQLQGLAARRRIKVARLPTLGYNSSRSDGREASIRHELVEQAMARLVD